MELGQRQGEVELGQHHGGGAEAEAGGGGAQVEPVGGGAQSEPGVVELGATLGGGSLVAPERISVEVGKEEVVRI